MKRAALYARVSLDNCEVCNRNEKSHNDNARGHAFKGQDPERQFLILRNYAAERNWKITEFQDRICGAVKTRSGLDALWVALRDKKFDVLVIDDYDRFARSVAQLVLALDELNALGIQFVAVKKNLDTNTPEGRLMFVIWAGLAEFQRAVIQRQVIEGLELAVLKCKHCRLLEREHGKADHEFEPQVLGRPKVFVDVLKILRLRAKGWPWAAIERKTGINRRTLKRATGVGLK